MDARNKLTASADKAEVGETTNSDDMQKRRVRETLIKYAMIAASIMVCILIVYWVV